MSTSKPRAQCVLEPINLHKQDEFDELLLQRKACGWKYSSADLEFWREQMDKTTKSMFWIHIPPPSDSSAPTGGVQRAGHISFQSDPDSDGHDPGLTSPDKSLLMISTFFIKVEHRGGGLGRAAMEQLEAMTQVEPWGTPDCRALTLTTLSRRYWDEDGFPHGKEIWGRAGLERGKPPASNEAWYARMGYVKWKDEPRYKQTFEDGTEPVMLFAAFMKKDMR